MGLMDILHGMQNGPHGQTQPSKGGMSPLTMALLALLAYKAYKKVSASSQNAAVTPAANTGAGPQGNGGGGGFLPGGLGSLGGLLAGGAAGGILSGGIKDLIDKLSQAGHGDAAKSWVGTGANQNISPNDLSKALGDDTVNSLTQMSGLSKTDLLNGMSEQLPQLVDRLTPAGRVPSEQEMARMV